LRVLKRVLLEDLTQPCVVAMDWDAYAASHGVDGKSGLFAALTSGLGKAPAAKATDAAATNIVANLGRVLPVERPVMLRTYLRDLARETLGYGESEPIALDQPLVAQGFDSLMSVDMRNRLNKSLGCALPASLLFDYPTLDRIAQYLLDSVIRFEDQPMATKGTQREDSAESILREIHDLVVS
jgi:acyl carrier protein